LESLAPEPGDGVVSWLPLSHDMGLVGMLLTGLAAGADGWTGGTPVVLLEPATFLRSPATWASALSHHRGSFTAAPDFGYRLASRRPPSGDVDLSHLRCAIVGGEMVRATTLDDFTARFEAGGLGRLALCPAYGMAEVGLAVSITAPREVWRDRIVSLSALSRGQVQRPRDDDDELRLVACGRPLPGYDVVCPEPEDGVGSIGVSGPSVGTDPLTSAPLAGEDGVYHPGDVGFADDGWLFVCGREDDTIVASGCNIYAPAIEAAVSRLDGIREGRVAVVGLPTGEWAVVAEPSHVVPCGSPRAAEIARSVRRAAVHSGATKPDRVVLVPRGQLPLTASGKTQRKLVRRKLVDGGLD
jgi:fatty-acyl-CoA synthase